MKKTRRFVFTMISVLAIGSTLYSADGPKIKSVEDVKKAVEHNFATMTSFQKGDLITQKQVTTLFERLEKLGWKAPEQKRVLERVLKDEDFLVTVLMTPDGREFLAKIKKYPNGIDRVDRMSKMPNGKVSVSDLINKIPNGHEWIKDMTTTKQGKRLGQQLSKASTGKDFNQPTERLYFVEDLTKELQKSFSESTTKMVKQNSPAKKQKRRTKKQSSTPEQKKKEKTRRELLQ